MANEPEIVLLVAQLKRAQARIRANGPTQTERDADQKLRERRRAEKAPERLRKKRAKSKDRSQKRRDKIKAETVVPVVIEPPVAKPSSVNSETFRALDAALRAYIANGNRQGQQLKTRAGTYLRAYLVLLDLRHELGADPKPAVLARRYADRWRPSPIEAWTPTKARTWGYTMIERLRSLEAPGGPWERDAKAMDPAKNSVTAEDGPSKAMNPDRHALRKSPSL